ncbi:MAG TPA: hypothetical protein VLV89_12835 [Candidatus Acidoferrum sp.]|nr:hypothetical protein [Candidatus Acidoferrum sp.]
MQARIITAIFTLLFPLSGLAQNHKFPVSVSQSGHDQVGSLFTSAFKRELSRSVHYEFLPPQQSRNEATFYVELMTVDMGDDPANQGKRSAISIVISEMGMPGDYPVPYKWYHKLIVVEKQTVDKIAKDLLDDMDASWCNQLKSSLGGCPKEKLEPMFWSHP